MSKKRTLSHSAGDNSQEPPNKKAKTDTTITSAALLTFQTDTPHYDRMGYRPLWICGNATNIQMTAEENHSFTPSEFLRKCDYPFIRFCNIPWNQFSSAVNNNYFREWHEYTYYHQLCIKHQIADPHEIIKFISDQLRLFDAKSDKLIGKKPFNLCGCSISHLFIMKEYINIQNNNWNQIIEEIKKSPPNKYLLPIDIIQHTISEFIYETKVKKDINYLNDNANIDQIKWFEYMFYFIEFASKEWQIFCYEYILKNGKYNNIIINLTEKYKKLAFRRFKYPLLTEFCLKLYPNKLSTPTITGFVKYTIEMNAVRLFEICLKLFDSHSIKPTSFWGTLLWNIAKIIEEDQLSLFNKVCLKMKEHCNGNKTIIDDSFKKFNSKLCDPFKHTNYEIETFKCVKVMENVLNYDIYTVIPYCNSNRNRTLMEYLVENDYLDLDVCNRNYSDEINNIYSL